jgi:CheY-like chemotaxis protein
MDHVMPGMSGIDATRAIKAKPGAPRIIILTSHDRGEVRAAAEAAGADGFLSKLDFASAVTAMQPPPPPGSPR